MLEDVQKAKTAMMFIRHQSVLRIYHGEPVPAASFSRTKDDERNHVGAGKKGKKYPYAFP